MVAWTWAEMALLLRLWDTKDGVAARLLKGVAWALSSAQASSRHGAMTVTTPPCCAIYERQKQQFIVVLCLVKRLCKREEGAFYRQHDREAKKNSED